MSLIAIAVLNLLGWGLGSVLMKDDELFPWISRGGSLWSARITRCVMRKALFSVLDPGGGSFK